jgi:hypothetical protein
MRIGSLVSNRLGGIGVVIKERRSHPKIYKVHWTTGACNWHDEIYLTLEVQ